MRKNRFVIGIVVIIIVMCTFTCAYAFELNNVIDGAFSFEQKTVTTAKAPVLEAVVGLTMVGQVVGTIIAIIIGLILAIKFMTQGAEAKADMKQSLTSYCIGVAILFGAYGVWSAVIGVLQTNLPLSPQGNPTPYVAQRNVQNYVIRPMNATPIKGQTPHNYNIVAGGGIVGESGIDWGSIESSSNTEFANKVADMVEDKNKTVSDIIKWAISRRGIAYSQNNRRKGQEWDTLETLTAEQKSNSNFDCSAFVSRGYYAVSGGSIFPSVSDWPMVTDNLLLSYTEVIGKTAKPSYQVKNASGRFSMYNRNIITYGEMKDYLQPGDIILCYQNSAEGRTQFPGHAMLFIGWLEDENKPLIIHSSGPVDYTTFSASTTLGAVIRPVDWTFDPTLLEDITEGTEQETDISNYTAITVSKPASGSNGLLSHSQRANKTIKWSNSFESTYIITVDLPLVGKQKIHKALKANYEAAFKNAQRLVDLGIISSSGFGSNSFYRRNSTGSAHQFGQAFDININVSIAGVSHVYKHMGKVNQGCGTSGCDGNAKVQYEKMVTAIGSEENFKNTNWVLYKYAFQPAGFSWGRYWNGDFDPMHFYIE